MTNLDSILKSRDITWPSKFHLVKAMVFSSSHVWMRELDYKESWVLKNWYFWTMVLEKTLESPLDCKEIQLVHPKGNQSWISWNSNTLSTWCEELTHLKRLWCWERLKAGGEGTTENEMVGWHYQLKGYEQAPGVGDGQGSLACSSLWSSKESDTTEQRTEHTYLRKCIHTYIHIFSLNSLRLWHLRINIKLLCLIIIKSPLDPGRNVSLQKQLFHCFSCWWPDIFAMSIWQYSPMAN